MMDAYSSRSLVVESENDFRVSTAAYREDQLFQDELHRIFYKTWIFLCHESEIPKPGDYKSTWIGRQPVIVVRDGTRNINAFLNFCRHRGAALCRYEYGNAKALVCPYHGWTYRVTGELMTVTDQRRYPEGFDVSSLGLIKVNRLKSYGGLVFGSLSDEGPDLEAHLGGARKYVDYWLARAANGNYRLDNAHKYSFSGNWKMQIENVNDGYHPNFVHRSAFSAFREAYGGSYGQQASEVGTVFQGGTTRGFSEGHSTMERDFPAVAGQQAAKSATEAYVNAIRERHGEATREITSARHIIIFPNLALMDYNIRVVQPLAADQTDVYSYFLSIDGASDEINAARLTNLQTRLGTAGMVGGDDIEIFAANQTGFMAESAPWIILNRGLGMETVGTNAEQIGTYSDEVPQRAFWRRWSRAMERE